MRIMKKLLDCWDWYYRIAIDNTIEKKVFRWMENLCDLEYKIMEEVVLFYRNILSIGILVDQIEEMPDRAKEFLNRVDRMNVQPLKTPEVLVQWFHNRIQVLPVDKCIKDQLHEILESSASGQEISPLYWEFCKQLFGDAWIQMKSVFDDPQYDDYEILPKQTLIDKKHKELFHSIFSSVTSNQKLISQYGKSAIEEFDLVIEEGMHYGEWWDRDLTNYEKDRLILFENAQSVREQDYFYTILHEAYPGHGQFYNAVRNEHTCMDHGAMALVEGWATYCEWHSYPSSYINVIRHNAMVSLRSSYRLGAVQRSEKLWKQLLQTGASEAQARQSLVYATQYPGFTEAYYLGALWLEAVINMQHKYTPETFLQYLKNHNKGVFFRLW